MHCTTHNCTTQQCTILHCTARHCTALHCTTLHYTASHYLALHFPCTCTFHVPFRALTCIAPACTLPRTVKYSRLNYTTLDFIHFNTLHHTVKTLHNTRLYPWSSLLCLVRHGICQKVLQAKLLKTQFYPKVRKSQ